MRYFLIMSAACLFAGGAAPVSAQHHHGRHGHHNSHHHRHSYPRYYGSNWASPGWSVSGRSGSTYFNFAFPGNTYYGNPYGPYFYNRFGYYSMNAFVAGNPVLFSNGYSLNGFAPILPGQGFSPPAVYPYSNVPGTLSLTNPQGTISNQPLNNVINQDLQRWEDPDYLPEPSRKVQKYIVPSTRHARELSLRNQVKGDEYFLKQDYRRAYERYKLAASLTKDLATPHFKKGFALVALKQFDRAAYEFKQGLALDPNWPVTGESLSELYGPENVIAKDTMLHQVADWVKEDIRDPERLFVFGVVLHFDGQTEQAHDVFQTAARLAGRGDHFLAFLDPKVKQGLQQPVKPQGLPASNHVINPANTRPPAFESKKSKPLGPSQPAAPKRAAPITGTLPPPPAVKQPPRVNNQALPPLPQDADSPGTPLIPVPEPAKSQQTPLLIPPK